MIINIGLAIFALTQVQAIEQKCEDVIISGISYKKEALKTDLDSPYQFSIDYNTNTLLFSYSKSAAKENRFQLAYINLNTEEFGIIPTIVDGFATAVDLTNKRIFLGGKQGIYDYNLITKQTNHLGASNHNIWQMFYKGGLYYTTYPTEEAHFFKNGTSQRLAELSGTRIMLIAVDENENIYFTNSSGLFKYKKSSKEVLQLGEHVINGLNADINGKLYFSTPNGIFTINEKQNTVELLVALEDVFSVAIERDGSIVYGTGDSIKRLKKSDKCNV